MQFICKSLISNEHFEGGNIFVFSIDKEYAAKLIKQRQECMDFLKSQGEEYMGKVVLGWRSSMSALTSGVLTDNETDQVITDALENAECHNGIEVIPDDFDPDSYDNDDGFDVVRLRGQQIMIYPDGSMRLTSYEKHSGDTLESEEFQLDLLEKALNG